MDMDMDADMISDIPSEILPFPQKLYMMLESVDSLGLSHTVSWSPDGRSFQVKDPTKFMALVVPHFFKATKFRSFQRQLNLWNFKRIGSTTKGREGWRHESFIRGCPEKLPRMSRTKTKGNYSRKQAPKSSHSPTLSTQGSTDSLDMSVEEETLQGSECGSSVNVDTMQVSNGTSPEVSFRHDVFDEKVEALFPIEEFSQNLERRIKNNDGGCTKNVNKMMSFRPQVPNNDDHPESNTFKFVNNCGATWDAMLIEIEPLPINCINVLGSESQTQNANLDDFQKFLGKLIK